VPVLLEDSLPHRHWVICDSRTLINYHPRLFVQGKSLEPWYFSVPVTEKLGSSPSSQRLFPPTGPTLVRGLHRRRTLPPLLRRLLKKYQILKCGHINNPVFSLEVVRRVLYNLPFTPHSASHTPPPRPSEFSQPKNLSSILVVII